MPFTIWRNVKKLMNTLGGNPPPAETAAPAPKKKPATPSPPTMEGTMTPQEYAAKKAALDAFVESRRAPSERAATQMEEKKKKAKAMMGP